MKTVLALLMTFSLSSAWGQNSWEKDNPERDSGTTGYSRYFKIAPQEQEAAPGQRRMVEFNAQSLPSALHAFQRSKTPGASGDDDSTTTVDLNYAYSIHPNVQIGGRFNYFKGSSGVTDVERAQIQAGAWFNSLAGDLANSPYISFHMGTGYSQTLGGNTTRDDLWLGTLALGKRSGLRRWGIEHLSWTPEVAFTTVNSTNNSSFEYRQAVELRFLQFSVLW